MSDLTVQSSRVKVIGPSFFGGEGVLCLGVRARFGTFLLNVQGSRYIDEGFIFAGLGFRAYHLLSTLFMEKLVNQTGSLN